MATDIIARGMVSGATEEAKELAKQAEQSANNAAQSATSAQNSATTAETAKNTAVEKSAEIADSAEKIEQNTADIEKMRDVIFLNPLNHNGIYRGKDLTNVYTIEQMYERIHNGTFEDLYLGDYFTVNITTTLPDGTVKTENAQLMYAHFNYYKNKGDKSVTAPHAVLIPRNAGFATPAKMNETNTTEGGYLNSYMHQTVLPCYAASLKAALNNHLLSHRSLLTNTINKSTPSMAGAGMIGAATNWEWADVELQLMNEVQLYGTTVWSSSARDVGIDNEKLAVFNFINPVEFGRTDFWLCSVVSSTAFAYCNSGGGANVSGASGAPFARPQILFG